MGGDVPDHVQQAECFQALESRARLGVDCGGRIPRIPEQLAEVVGLSSLSPSGQ
jgi:hypothetical protein